MRARILLLLLLLVNITFTTSAYEKVSDKYAEGASLFSLIAKGFSTEYTNSSVEKDIDISIIRFESDEWSICIIFNDEVYLFGSFKIETASKVDGGVFFTGYGKSNLHDDGTETCQQLEFQLFVDNSDAILNFSTREKNKYLGMSLNRFVVSKKLKDTEVLFLNESISDIRKPGSLKQLKKLLLKSPFLR